MPDNEVIGAVYTFKDCGSISGRIDGGKIRLQFLDVAALPAGVPLPLELQLANRHLQGNAVDIRGRNHPLDLVKVARDNATLADLSGMWSGYQEALQVLLSRCFISGSFLASQGALASA